MDKKKESVGLERQRNVIIKRYVTEIVRISYLYGSDEIKALAKQRCLLAKNADVQETNDRYTF